MTARVFALPDLGEGLTEAELLRWLVTVGEEITVDQPVAEVETAKASVEVPSPYAGTVTELHGTPGDTLDVGAPLVTVGGAEPAPTGAPAQAPDTPVSGNVLVGFGTRETTRRSRAARRLRLVGAGRGRPAENGSGADAGPDSAADAGRSPGAHRVAVVSPLVRRVARENAVDLADVPGSGPDGLVLRRDVEAAVQRTAGDRAGSERISLRGVRGAAADRLTRSRREIPEATVWVDVDATEFCEVRAQINAKDPDRPVSLLGLLARFCVLGLARFTELNARVDVDAREIVLNPRVNLGFAAQTPRGLVVPVVADAQQMTARALSGELTRLATAARAGTLSPGELTGGTFTVNNYGVFGVDGSAAIINHPEVAILGMGRIVDRPWVVHGELAVRTVTELTLAFDHRVCDGETAGGFLRFVADCVEHPTLLLADL